MDRIGENPGTYDGTNQENPDQQKARTWTDGLEEDISEAACPLGFMKESPIATAFCSDIDEVGFTFCSHVFTNMTHNLNMTHKPKKCKGNAAGCHPQKADCDNNVGGFNCNCKYYKYKYGDGYDCFEDLNFLIFSSKEPKSDEQKSEFVKLLTIRTWLNQVDWKHT